MTQADKDLLVKDLCARLPYGTKYEVDGFKPNVKCRNGKLDDNVWDTLSLIIDTESEYHELCHIKHINPDGIIYHNYVHFSKLKPYLFPISSMTDEQKEEFNTRSLELQLKVIDDEIMYEKATEFEVDFYNKHHLDWRGLIPNGLAKDATGLNIY